LLAVAAQLALPRIVAGGIEDRLTERGGQASAEVDAFPAPRLLFGDGDRLQVSGSDLELELEVGESDGLSELDSFDEVDMRLASLRTGSIEVSSFQLSRRGEEPYRLQMRGRSTASELALIGSAALGAGALGELGSAFLQGALGTQAVPLDLDLLLQSDDGTPRVVGGQASAAGIDVTAIAALIASAVAVNI